MVRVGGGWVALDEFLVKNDPCRGMFYFQFKFIFSFLNFIYERKRKEHIIRKDAKFSSFFLILLINLILII